MQKAARLFLAHGYGQLVTIAGNLLTPAILAAAWGGREFGFWLALGAAAQFCILFDLGLSQALGNHLCISCAGDNRRAWIAVKLVLEKVLKRVPLGVLLSLLLSYVFWKFGEQYNSLKYVICVGEVLALTSMTQAIVTVLVAVERFYDQNDRGVFVSNSMRLLDILTTCLIVGVFDGGVVLLSGVILLLKVVVIAVWLKLTFRKCDGLQLAPPLDTIDLKDVEMAGHGFAKLTLGSGVVLQLPVYLASIFFGEVFSAVLATSRTLCRVPSQLCLLMSLTAGPEITRYYKDGNIVSLRRLVRLMLIGFCLVSFAWLFLLLNFSELISKLWLSGEIKFPFWLLVIMGVSAVSNIAYQVLVGALSASNFTQGIGAAALKICMILAVYLVLAGYVRNEYWYVFGVLMFEMVSLVLAVKYYDKKYCR